MALSDDLENLVKPERIQEHELVKYQWFLKDDSSYEARFPGKLKTEFESSDGMFVGLSSKCYVIGRNDDVNDKICSKGVHHSIKLNRDQFRETLYDVKHEEYGSSQLFTYSKQSTQMNTVIQRRKLLNSFYTKFCVQSDLVTVKPLQKNKDYI